MSRQPFPSRKTRKPEPDTGIVIAQVETYFGDPTKTYVKFSRPPKMIVIHFLLGNLVPRWEKVTAEYHNLAFHLRMNEFEDIDEIYFEVPAQAAREFHQLAHTALSSMFRPIQTSKCVYCVRDFRDLPLETYALPGDGRKAKHIWAERQRLAEFLATFANPDGTSITVGVPKIARKRGMSRAKVFRLLNDLRILGLLVDGEKTEFQGTTERSLRVPVQGIPMPSIVSDSSAPTVSDSKPMVSNSTPMVSNRGPFPPNSLTYSETQPEELPEEDRRRESPAYLPASNSTSTATSTRNSKRSKAPQESVWDDATIQANDAFLALLWEREHVRFELPLLTPEHRHEWKTILLRDGGEMCANVCLYWMETNKDYLDQDIKNYDHRIFLHQYEQARSAMLACDWKYQERG